MFRRVLVANRGEIAVRIIRAIHDLGGEAVAVFSDADRAALHVRLADYAYHLGPAPAVQSYLDQTAVLDAARRAGAQALHPGYGFLAENAAFARRCAGAGIAFVGPSPEAMAQLGDKVAARRLAASVGVPTVPGTPDPVAGDAAARAAAARIGYPLLIKAAAGGGGKGMRAVWSEDDLGAALVQARSEAAAAFGDDSVFLERLVERPRHIEVQVFGDGAGRVVHLGERDCSVQRRYQKLVEEAFAPNLSDGVRGALCKAAVDAASAARYGGAGTVEFLYEPSSERFYFLEMNTRLQVEHPVTELVTGVDLVKAQLLLAAGEPLAVALAGGTSALRSGTASGEDAVARARWPLGSGHAIEARILAEDPANRWFPSTGRVALLREPGGPGIRVDSACEPGMEVTINYDSLLAKLVAWGRTRDEAIARLRRALDEYVVTGVRTTLPFHRWLVRDDAFLAGNLSTGFVTERWTPERAGGTPGADVTQAAALAVAHAVASARHRQMNGHDDAGDIAARAGTGSRWLDAARRGALR